MSRIEESMRLDFLTGQLNDKYNFYDYDDDKYYEDDKHHHHIRVADCVLPGEGVTAI